MFAKKMKDNLFYVDNYHVFSNLNKKIKQDRVDGQDENKGLSYVLILYSYPVHPVYPVISFVSLCGSSAK